jgi:hypothetical protein
VYHNVPSLDVHGYVPVTSGGNDTCDAHFPEAAMRRCGVPRMLSGAEAPGSGRAVRQETGTASDNLDPLIGAFGFRAAEVKMKVFTEDPARVIPAPGKIR